MPNTLRILNTNLISQQNLRTRSLPASVPSSRDHEFARRIEVDRADDAATMAWHDGEGHCSVARGRLLGEVVDAEDVLRSAVVSRKVSNAQS